MEEFIMNKYQIQIEHKTENKWDWICIYANSDEEAIQNAKIQLYDYQNPIYLQDDNYNAKYWKDYYKEKYQDYIISPYVPIFSVERNCHLPISHDTIISSNTKENKNMAFFNVNWKDYKDALLKVAAPEPWSNETYPNDEMLVNYMVHTVKKLKSEKNIIQRKEYGLFNTGLFTIFYEPIFAYATSECPISFMTPYELGSIGIDEYPERANYFEDPSLLLFDWHYKINIYYKHILDDINNIKRLPQNMQENKNILNNLNGSIETMKKRVSANYKLAIPQYFDNKIQLLLPLCLQSDETPDLALVVTKVGNVYQGHTCLTLDMAYNNARLIAKPESNWLSATNIVK